MDRVAHHRRRLDVERGVEEGEPGVLHGRQQEALGEGIDQRTGHQPRLVFLVDGEQLLGQPRKADEGRAVGLADRAPVGTEAKAGLQILKRETAADQDHFLSNCLLALSNASCTPFNAESAPRIMSRQALADALCTRRSSARASSRRARNCSTCLALALSHFAACAFQWSICSLSFWTYSSRLIMRLPASAEPRMPGHSSAARVAGRCPSGARPRPRRWAEAGRASRCPA